MVETHYAYKYQDFTHNFSFFLREPTFFYRPSGQFVLSVTAATLILSIIPLYQYIDGLVYKYQNKDLDLKISHLNKTIWKFKTQGNKLEKEKRKIEPVIKKLAKDIKRDKQLIEEVYKFKYSYIPKSQQLTDITYFLNKNHVYVKNLSYSHNIFLIDVFSNNDSNIANLIEDLTKNGFNTYTDGVKLENKKYTSKIRITE
jgi:hypothetical protein